MKYVKKQIPVNAWEWDGAPLVQGLPSGILHSVRESDFGGFVGKIASLEGDMNIFTGDWIVGPGVEGEYWVVSKTIFPKTYEPYESN